MEMNSYELLETVIIQELQKAQELPEGNGKDEIFKNVAALYKVHNEEQKNSFESEDRRDSSIRESDSESRNLELEYKKLQFQEKELAINDAHHRVDVELEEKKLRQEKLELIVNTSLAAATTVIGVLSYSVWYRKGLKFEETGTVTSPFVKGIIQKMIPAKK